MGPEPLLSLTVACLGRGRVFPGLSVKCVLSLLSLLIPCGPGRGADSPGGCERSTVACFSSALFFFFFVTIMNDLDASRLRYNCHPRAKERRED